MTIEEAFLQVVFPKEIFEWFDPADCRKDEQIVHLVFEEKNIPPREEKHRDKRIPSKGFTDITIRDFPIRGRETLLTFRRRYWQVEGEQAILKRTINLSFPGTQLEKEFADFLKEFDRE